MKRTDLEAGRDFFWGVVDVAAEKSGARVASLGVVVVELDVGLVEEEEENCEVRSVSWVRKRGSWVDIDLCALGD